MNFTRNKIILYILIIANGIDFILPWPIFSQKPFSRVEDSADSILSETRSSRQVVQPTWLNKGQNIFVDPKVHVNPQSLEEAAKIRSEIQKAVDEGTYAVPDEESNPNDNEEPSPPAPVTNRPSPPPPPMTPLQNWQQQMQQMWQNWQTNLQPNLFTAAAAPNTSFPPIPVPAWFQEMQRVWQNWQENWSQNLSQNWTQNLFGGLQN